MTATTIVSRPIRQLPVELANQIAAGEVVERPASVVKELLENSLDAGASRIEISIRHGGLQEIIIRDNGAGIPKTELPLAISRHATSKITDLHELENIQSLGFRGEALASIGSVSRMQLVSCCIEATEAWQIDCASDDLSVRQASHPTGTSITVKDLFYNTPARRKFMRSDKTEFRYIDEVVRRMALSHFDVGFSFRHNDRLVYQFAPADSEPARQRRLARLCGKAFMMHAVQIDFSLHDLRLKGWITSPAFSRSQTDLQHFYVNGRIIRDRLIAHAIRQVYQACLPQGRHSAYVLQLEIAPSAVDVNVHPAKHEVRFREARLVHDFIHRCARDALSGDQENHINPVADRAPRQPVQAYRRLDFPSAGIAESTSGQDYPLGQSKGLVNNRFVIAQNSRGLVLVDARQAQAQLIFKKLTQSYANEGIQSRPLLMPKTIPLTEQLLSQLEQSQACLQILGFDLTCTGPTSVMVRMVPVVAGRADLEHLLISLLEQEPARQAIETLLQVIAEITAETQILSDSGDELNRLLREIETLDNSRLWRCLTAADMLALIQTRNPSAT